MSRSCAAALKAGELIAVLAATARTQLLVGLLLALGLALGPISS